MRSTNSSHWRYKVQFWKNPHCSVRLCTRPARSAEVCRWASASPSSCWRFVQLSSTALRQAFARSDALSTRLVDAALDADEICEHSQKARSTRTATANKRRVLPGFLFPLSPLSAWPPVLWLSWFPSVDLRRHRPREKSTSLSPFSKAKNVSNKPSNLVITFDSALLPVIAGTRPRVARGRGARISRKSSQAAFAASIAITISSRDSTTHQLVALFVCFIFEWCSCWGSHFHNSLSSPAKLAIGYDVSALILGPSSGWISKKKNSNGFSNIGKRNVNGNVNVPFPNIWKAVAVCFIVVVVVVYLLFSTILSLLSARHALIH